MKIYKRKCQLVDKQCSDLAAIVTSIERDIATKEQACKTLENDTEVFVEQQIELTKLKIDVTNRKLELAKAKVKVENPHKNHQKDYQRAKNLFVSSSISAFMYPLYIAT